MLAWSRFCTVNCQPTANNYQLSHMSSSQDSNFNLRAERRGNSLSHGTRFNQQSKHINWVYMEIAWSKVKVGVLHLIQQAVELLRILGYCDKIL